MFFFLPLILKRALFRHLYVEEEFLEELSSELDFNCNYDAEIFILADYFPIIESVLFKLLSAGKKLDLIIYSNRQHRSIQLTHALIRFISQGGQVHWTGDLDGEVCNFAILDKTYLISEMTIIEEDSSERIVSNARKKFREIKKQSDIFQFSPQKIELNFFVEKEFVRKGEANQIRWDAVNADFVVIDPWIGVTETKGFFPLKLEEDTLVKITASNSSERITKSLFIKVIPGETVDFEVSVFEEDIEEFMPIQSPVEFPGSYAVSRGQRIRIRWNGGSHGRLFSQQLGNLKLQDVFETEIFEDRQFDFEYRDIFEKATYTLRFFTIEKYLDKDEKPELALIGVLWKAIITMFIKRA